MEEEIPLFVMGAMREPDEVHKSILPNRIKKEFQRPLHITAV